LSIHRIQSREGVAKEIQMEDSNDHILDNPIWNALQTGDRTHAWGNEMVKGIDRSMGAFVGMVDQSEDAWRSLWELVPAGSVAVMFTTNKLDVPSNWKIGLERVLLQMVHVQEANSSSSNDLIRDIGEEDIPAMLTLTQLTKPGPFFQRTIDFGHYQGIFENGELVSMAGQRFKPDPFTEVSAVCTHPGSLGKGYAGKLIASQVSMIRNSGRIPFLHVYPDNKSAISLYRKLGFEVRKEMLVYVISHE
jgi:ribosomal protein S18 acetylase RimI-like enzyme